MAMHEGAMISDTFSGSYFTQRPTYSVDGGNSIETWSIYTSSLEGRIRSLSGTELRRNEIKMIDSSHRFYTSYTTDILETDRIGNDLGTAVTVTGATHNAGVVTVAAAAHGLAVGDRVRIKSVVGMTDLNNVFLIATVPTSATFTVALSTSQTYTSGGTVQKCNLYNIVFINNPHEQDEFLEIDLKPIER